MSLCAKLGAGHLSFVRNLNMNAREFKIEIETDARAAVAP